MGVFGKVGDSQEVVKYGQGVVRDSQEMVEDCLDAAEYFQEIISCHEDWKEKDVFKRNLELLSAFVAKQYQPI